MIIYKEFDWTEKRHWEWGESDKGLYRVIDQVDDINTIMEFVPADRRGVCVQAGAANGIWPARFNTFFDHVFTFEPYRENFNRACINLGMGHIDFSQRIYSVTTSAGVTIYHAGLGAHRHYADFIPDPENDGAGYIGEAAYTQPTDVNVEIDCVDSLGLEECGLIQLDIEGMELQALVGAAETIDRCRPVIVLEEKPLKHLQGKPEAPREWLQSKFGYNVVERVNRDVILTC